MHTREADELDGVLRELVACEPIFHRPEWGTTRADFDRTMAPEFWEIGASGKVYERAFVLDLLEERHRTPQVETLTPFGFRISRISAETYLLHYNLHQDARETRRTTVWRREAEGWKILFHQGTVMTD